MSEVRLFRRADQDLTPAENGAAVIGLVNTAFSDRLGAGIGVFEDCAMEWTVTYDEVLFVLKGRLRLDTDAGTYRAGPGDTLWIPEGTRVVYAADAPVTFFYAVSPVEKSPSTGNPERHPTAPPAERDFDTIRNWSGTSDGAAHFPRSTAQAKIQALCDR